MRCKCGSSYIQNHKLWLCSECVFKRNHNGKSKAQFYKERSTRYKRKITGEKNLFLEIWKERDHVCSHCGEYLGAVPRAIYFSHIKSKGSKPSKRLDKSNIELLCSNCHQEYEFGKKKRI